jgi:hypothetical protein
MCFLCAEAHIEAQHTVILQNDALVNIPAPALELSNKEPTQVNKNALEVLNLLNQGKFRRKNSNSHMPNTWLKSSINAIWPLLYDVDAVFFCIVLNALVQCH